jgi:hypothetical protein
VDPRGARLERRSASARPGIESARSFPAWQSN